MESIETDEVESDPITLKSGVEVGVTFVYYEGDGMFEEAVGEGQAGETGTDDEDRFGCHLVGSFLRFSFFL